MVYDILIVGGGPAGITAGIYAKRAGRKVAIIEKLAIGGQINLIGQIENYSGFASIGGGELAENFYEQVKSLNIPIINDEIIGYDLISNDKVLSGRKASYSAKAVVLALGSHPRELAIKGENKFKGQGVSYCTLCDGNFFKNKVVAVVGSGDSAISDAIYLSNICKKVYILTKKELNLHNYNLTDIEDKNNVEIIKGAISQEIIGENKIEMLSYFQEGQEKQIDVEGVFVAIGRKPQTEKLQGQIDLTDNGYIISDKFMHTNQEGVFVCGDVRDGIIKQIATAVGDGAIAGTEASKYVTFLVRKVTK